MSSSTGHTAYIREARLANGAGFLVAIAGGMMTMPGLPKKPATERIDMGETAGSAGGVKNREHKFRTSAFSDKVSA